jgi:hypothetical protein
MSVDLESLQRASRLAEMGLLVRSAELTQQADELRAFVERGGNRKMRRAAAKAARRRKRSS